MQPAWHFRPFLMCSLPTSAHPASPVRNYGGLSGGGKGTIGRAFARQALFFGAENQGSRGRGCGSLAERDGARYLKRREEDVRRVQ